MFYYVCADKIDKAQKEEKAYIEEQKKIAKDVAAMWKLPQTNQYTIRQLFTVFEIFEKVSLCMHAF